MSHIYYIHGSEDSLDVDVHYVFQELPEFKYCQTFCKEDPNENRNIIVIKNGIVVDCFKGTPDEINNALLETYHLHHQKYPLLVNTKVDRNVTLKDIRCVRGVLSLLSRTNYRSEIKSSLIGGWKKRLNCLEKIDFAKIDYSKLGKHQSEKDILKVIAFQFGQTIGLHEQKELYTKSSVAKEYKELNPFLYREKDLNLNDLNQYKNKLLDFLSLKKVIEYSNCEVYFVEDNTTYNLKHEEIIQKERFGFDECR